MKSSIYYNLVYIFILLIICTSLSIRVSKALSGASELSASLSSDVTTLKQGDTATLTISINSNNSLTTGFSAVLKYDKTKYSLKSQNAALSLGSSYKLDSSDESYGLLLMYMDYTNGALGVAHNGPVFTVTLQALDTTTFPSISILSAKALINGVEKAAASNSNWTVSFGGGNSIVNNAPTPVPTASTYNQPVVYNQQAEDNNPSGNSDSLTADANTSGNNDYANLELPRAGYPPVAIIGGTLFAILAGFIIFKLVF